MSKLVSKFAKGSSFSPEVSDAIRHHVGMRSALESKRKIAFDDRDNAVSELAGLKSSDGKEATRIKTQHSDAVLSIETLSKQIKWHNNQLDDLVNQADEPQFEFAYEMPAEAPKEETQTLHDARPVGRPGKTKPQVPDPSKGDGVDEHLKASVNELDVIENIKGKLVTAGYDTIGKLAAAIDGDKDLGELANLNQNQAAAVKKSVKAYRKEHRQAMLENTEGQ